MGKEDLLRNIFISLMILLFALIVSTPILINRGIAVMGEATKEIVEAAMLFVLIGVGFVIYFLYKRKLKRREKELDETLRYVGAVNLQVDQIRSIFDLLTKYPESKEDFKFIFEKLAGRALAGVNSDWVLFRIIEIASGKTLTEYTKARGVAVLLKCEISNKELMEGKNPESCQAVASEQENLNIKVFCIMPIKQLNKNQEVLLKAIVSNLGMLYLVFESIVAKKLSSH